MGLCVSIALGGERIKRQPLCDLNDCGYDINTKMKYLPFMILGIIKNLRIIVK